MKIILAPDSFKGTLSALEVCDIEQSVIQKNFPDAEIKKIPIADGGEGTVDAFMTVLGGEKIFCEVTSPLGRKISAYYGIIQGDTAVIEMAQASGITIEKENNALLATTYGTGEMIKNALDKGIRKIILGIGGSATTDGGVGCVQALGGKFLDSDGEQINLGGVFLGKIDKIDLSALDKRLKDTQITVLCDVKNPLYGTNGAAYIYAPQKGANENDVQILDAALRVLAIETRIALGEDYSQFEGAGAAGGLGFACKAFLGAELKSGIDVVLETAKFEAEAETADLIITGEGKMDMQSLMGKAPFGVASRAGDTKTIAIVGLLDADRREAKRLGIDDIFETNAEHKPFEEVKKTAKEDLRIATEKMLQIILNNT